VAKEYANGKQRRQEILDAAARLFGTEGYRAVSLRTIASSAGITHPTLLHHFPTKEDLLAAVLLERDEDTARRFAEVESWNEFRELARETDTANREHLHWIAAHTRLAAEATETSHPAHAYYRRRYEVAIEVGTGAIARDGRALPGSLTPADVSRILIAVEDGLQTQWLFDDSVDVPGIVARLIDVLLPIDSAAGAPEAAEHGESSTD
jgi:AcrR family transcriptional regulator